MRNPFQANGVEPAGPRQSSERGQAAGVARVCFHGLLFAAGLLSLGCVAPSGASGPVSIQGKVSTPSGDPVEGLRLEIVLPQSYGLREKEMRAGQSMDFGSPRRVLEFVTNAEGQFEGDFGEQPYQVNLWVFPPLGAVPGSPPPPAILIRLPDFKDEHYYVQTGAGTCEVMKSNGASVTLEASRLKRVDARAEALGGSRPGTRAVLELTCERP